MNGLIYVAGNAGGKFEQKSLFCNIAEIRNVSNVQTTIASLYVLR